MFEPISPDPRADLEGNLLDSVGTAAYHPGTVVFGTRSQPGAAANAPRPVIAYAGPQSVPNPAFEGEAAPEGKLGHSRGFGDIFRATAFRGRTLVVAAMGANPREGHIGFLTRSMRAKVEALTTDNFPNDTDVANAYADSAG